MVIDRIRPDRGQVALAVGLVGLAALALLVVTPVPADRAALVLRFGQPVRVINGWRPVGEKVGENAGLAWRWPIAERVVWVDRRLMTVALDDTRATTRDGEPLALDTYATWRVRDPVRFYEALGNSDQAGPDHADEQFRGILASVLRQQLGRRSMADIAAMQTGQGLAAIRDAFDRELAAYGAQVADLGLSRVALPDGAPLDAALARMSAGADIAAQDIAAQSHRTARLIRADAEARAIQIYAASFAKDPQFYDFYGAMQSYDATLGQRGSHTTIVLSPDNAYLKQFRGR